jgi:hypothetical protein
MFFLPQLPLHLPALRFVSAAAGTTGAAISAAKAGAAGVSTLKNANVANALRLGVGAVLAGPTAR